MSLVEQLQQPFFRNPPEKSDQKIPDKTQGQTSKATEWPGPFAESLTGNRKPTLM